MVMELIFKSFHHLFCGGNLISDMSKIKMKVLGSVSDEYIGIDKMIDEFGLFGLKMHQYRK